MVELALASRVAVVGERLRGELAGLTEPGRGGVGAGGALPDGDAARVDLLLRRRPDRPNV